MEIKLEWKLRQVGHLLQGLETNDAKLSQEIEDLRVEVVNAVYLCSINQEVVAEAHLEGVISPRVDRLVSELGSRQTEPPSP